MTGKRAVIDLTLREPNAKYQKVAHETPEICEGPEYIRNAESCLGDESAVQFEVSQDRVAKITGTLYTGEPLSFVRSLGELLKRPDTSSNTPKLYVYKPSNVEEWRADPSIWLRAPSTLIIHPPGMSAQILTHLKIGNPSIRVRSLLPTSFGREFASNMTSGDHVILLDYTLIDSQWYRQYSSIPSDWQNNLRNSLCRFTTRYDAVTSPEFLVEHTDASEGWYTGSMVGELSSFTVPIGRFWFDRVVYFGVVERNQARVKPPQDFYGTPGLAVFKTEFRSDSTWIYCARDDLPRLEANSALVSNLLTNLKLVKPQYVGIFSRPGNHLLQFGQVGVPWAKKLTRAVLGELIARTRSEYQPFGIKHYRVQLEKMPTDIPLANESCTLSQELRSIGVERLEPTRTCSNFYDSLMEHSRDLVQLKQFASLVYVQVIALRCSVGEFHSLLNSLVVKRFPGRLTHTERVLSESAGRSVPVHSFFSNSSSGTHWNLLTREPDYCKYVSECDCAIPNVSRSDMQCKAYEQPTCSVIRVAEISFSGLLSPLDEELCELPIETNLEMSRVYAQELVGSFSETGNDDSDDSATRDSLSEFCSELTLKSNQVSNSLADFTKSAYEWYQTAFATSLKDVRSDTACVLSDEIERILQVIRWQSMDVRTRESDCRNTCRFLLNFWSWTSLELLMKRMLDLLASHILAVDDLTYRVSKLAPEFSNLLPNASCDECYWAANSHGWISFTGPTDGNQFDFLCQDCAAAVTNPSRLLVRIVSDVPPVLRLSEPIPRIFGTAGKYHLKNSTDGIAFDKRKLLRNYHIRTVWGALLAQTVCDAGGRAAVVLDPKFESELENMRAYLKYCNISVTRSNRKAVRSSYPDIRNLSGGTCRRLSKSSGSASLTPNTVVLCTMEDAKNYAIAWKEMDIIVLPFGVVEDDLDRILNEARSLESLSFGIVRFEEA